MILRDITPSPPLQAYVRKHQIIRFKFGATIQLPVKAYWPRPEQCIMFYLRDLQNISTPNSNIYEKHPNCTISGQYTFVSNRYVTNDFWALQIVLQPGALYRLTGIPTYELANTFIDAEAIWNPEIRQVHEQISNCDNVDESIKIAEDFLSNIIRKSKYDSLGIDKVGQIILLNEMPQSIDYLANQSCLSVRQFNRKFTERNGVGPKSFDRINRFDRAIRMKNRLSSLDWLSIAVACGYYDYQHMAKDFLDFTAMTPNSFYELDTKAPERGFGNKEI